MVAGEERDRRDGYRALELSDLAVIPPPPLPLLVLILRPLRLFVSWVHISPARRPRIPHVEVARRLEMDSPHFLSSRRLAPALGCGTCGIQKFSPEPQCAACVGAIQTSVPPFFVFSFFVCIQSCNIDMNQTEVPFLPSSNIRC